MKTITAASIGLTVLFGALGSAAHAADVGVSIGISQPGVYGRIDIGRFPQPTVVLPQPVIIHQPGPVVVAQPVQPVYMWVPPGHRKNWRHHCKHYGACGVPVYFVEDRWYNQHVRGDGHPGKGHGQGHGKHKNKHD